MAQRSRPLVIFISCLVLLMGAYSGWWMFLASGLRDSTQTWIAERRAHGHEAAYGDLEVGGFPFALRLRLNDASYILNPDGESWAWRGGDMAVTLRPWDPGHLKFSLGGVHRFTYTSGRRSPSRMNATRRKAVSWAGIMLEIAPITVSPPSSVVSSSSPTASLDECFRRSK